MPTINLTNAFIAQSLQCPPGRARIEYCDADLPGLYVEARATSPGQGTYYLRSKDQAGKTCHTKLGRTTEVTLAEARQQAKTLKAEIRLGMDARTQQAARHAVPTLATFFDDAYLPHVRPRKRSWKRDVGLFGRVRARFGEVRLNELKRQDVQVFHADLLNHGIAPATADHHVKLMRQMLNVAVEWGVIEANPIARIKLFNPDNRLENYLSPDELDRLLAVLRTHGNRAVCQLALFLLSTGARLKEALSATWADIDKPNRVWRIAAATSKSKRVRSVPLNDAAMEVLATVGTEDKHEHLFVSAKTGQKLTWIHKSWDRIRDQAELPHLRIHDLRHQYASFLVNSGRSLYEVQKILGHSNHTVTERYAHLSSRALMEAANSASAFLKARQPEVEPKSA